MRVTIDTKEDSPEQIKHAINILTNLLGEEKVLTNRPLTQESSPAQESKEQQANVFDNIFNNNQAASQPQQQEAAPQPQAQPTQDAREQAILSQLENPQQPVQSNEPYQPVLANQKEKKEEEPVIDIPGVEEYFN